MSYSSSSQEDEVGLIAANLRAVACPIPALAPVMNARFQVFHQRPREPRRRFSAVLTVISMTGLQRIRSVNASGSLPLESKPSHLSTSTGVLALFSIPLSVTSTSRTFPSREAHSVHVDGTLSIRYCHS